MLEKPKDIGPLSEVQSIDTEKLAAVFRKNLIWIILIFIAANLAAYLTIRYTKDLFESESEMKLDVKRDATELGIKTYIEDQNMNLVSGEIEQIKSKLFFNSVLDSLNLSVSYYSLGKVLTDEMYKRSPFIVTPTQINPVHYDQSIFFDFQDNNQFTVHLSNAGPTITGTLNKPVEFDGTVFTISKTKYFTENDGNNYFFVLNTRKALIEYLSKNIQVDPLNFNANTIRVSFRDYNALKAYDIVNKIDSLYIIYSNQQKNLANQQKITWLNNELVQVERKMEGYEDYFENFTLQNKSSDLTLDLKKTIMSINAVDSQRYNLNKRLTELNTLINQVTAEDFSPASPARIFPESVHQRLDELYKQVRERNKLGLAYNENTFAFRQKEKEVTMLKDELFNQLSSLKKEWLADMAELSRRKENLEREFAEMPDKNTQFSKNQRYYKLYEEFYLTMMQSKAEFEIAQAGSTPDFKILSPATLPTTPISPSKVMVMGIGFVAGIVLNILFIGLVYLINNKITSVKEIERGITLPMLGAIPASTHITQSIFHVIDNPKSVVSEAIRTLRTNLEFFNTGDEKSKVITITSTISGEGKSFLAMNLGGVLALSRKRVVLVDLDMRKPKSEKYPTGNDSPMGMSTILIKKNKWQDCVIKTSLENFDFIPSGPHPPNPSELLLNGEFSDFLEELKAAYDYVVIDTPPVGLVTDGIMAMKRSDLSIYVFRANYSQKDFLQNLARVVTLNKLVHVSSVLNAIPANGKYYGYGYYEDKTPRMGRWAKIFRFR